MGQRSLRLRRPCDLGSQTFEKFSRLTVGPSPRSWKSKAIEGRRDCDATRAEMYAAQQPRRRVVCCDTRSPSPHAKWLGLAPDASAIATCRRRYSQVEALGKIPTSANDVAGAVSSRAHRRLSRRGRTAGTKSTARNTVLATRHNMGLINAECSSKRNHSL